MICPRTLSKLTRLLYFLASAGPASESDRPATKARVRRATKDLYTWGSVNRMQSYCHDQSAYGQDGHIITLPCRRPRPDSGEHPGKHLVGVLPDGRIQAADDARDVVRLEVRAVGPVAFDESVGEGQEAIPTSKRHGLLAPRTAQARQQWPGALAQHRLLIRRDEHRWLMAGIGEGHRFSVGIDDRDERGDEIFVITTGHGSEIRRCGGIQTGGECPAQQVLHAQRSDDGSGPVAGCIGDYYSQSVPIDRDGIPPITSQHTLRRGTGPRDLDTSNVRRGSSIESRTHLRHERCILG